VKKTKPKNWKYSEIEKDSRIIENLGVFVPATKEKYTFKNEAIKVKTKRVTRRMERELIEDKLEIDDDTTLGKKLLSVA